jgi:TonB-dependent starch-binding outer membrane protein SusC
MWCAGHDSSAGGRRRTIQLNAHLIVRASLTRQEKPIMARLRASAWTKQWRMATAVLGLALMLPASLHAQGTGRIRGRITESGTDRPVNDVQVTIAGSTLGALSSANGEYTISNVPAGTHVLHVRRIGYARATRSVVVTSGGETRADFTMTQAASQLDAVVVTGTAGEAERRTVGNAITQLGVADITKTATISNISEILQARSPGVQIAAGSGTPGTASDIRIRGAGSFSATPPVVYIDGVRMSTADMGNFAPSGQGLAANSGGQTANALDMVNPNDIESIEIIKGPAAATLYGADAAGGVIQIITKKGTRGQQQTRWTVRSEMGRNDADAIDFPINYTTCDAAKIALPATWPGCVGQPVGTVLTQSPIRDLPGALRDGAVRRYSVSARGGAEKFSFYVSGDHDYEEGVLHNSFNRRNSLRSNFTFSPSEKADMGINLGIYNSRLRLPLGDESAQGILFSSQRARPGIAGGPAGSGQTQHGWFTITPEQSNLYDNQTRSNRVTVAATVNYQPISWFRNRLTAGLDWSDGQATLFAPPNTPVLMGNNLGLTAVRNPRNSIYTIDYTGSVERPLPRDLVSTTSFGSQVVASRYDALVGTGIGLGSPDVTLIGSTTTISANNAFSQNNSVGYYLQEQLGWKNRLFVTGAVRADDNSSFGTDFDLIVYPKFSLAWVLSEEPSLAGVFQTLRVDNFKFRTAWGQAGRAPAPYSATRTFTISTVTLGTATESALRTGAFGNPGLKPERGQELEVGFDAGLLGGRAGIELTYYDKQMKDVLFSQSVAPSSGFSGGMQANLGSTSNKGLELGLMGTPVQLPQFSWDTRVSLSTNRNRLESFGDTSVTFVTLLGQSYGQVQQHRAGYPLGGYWARFPLRNADGSLALTGAGAIQLDTAVFVGPSTPTREVAFSNTFTFLRNFSLYSLFDWKSGHYNYRGAELYRCAASQNCQALNDPNTPAADMPIYRAGLSTPPHGVYIHKADFVKLRDLSLTWTAPERFATAVSASAMSLTLAGHNLALWSDYPGPDPEVNTYGNRALSPGGANVSFVRGDIYSMPMTRRLSAALNLTF